MDEQQTDLKARLNQGAEMLSSHGSDAPRHASSEDRTPTHGYEATREAAMAAFAKSWRRE